MVYAHVDGVNSLMGILGLDATRSSDEDVSPFNENIPIWHR